MLQPSDFYNRLADRYDGMTQFNARLDAQRSMLSDLLVRYPASRVVDMGCGTGVHAIALAQLGADVTGVDVSEGMLAKARLRAADAAVQVEFLHGDFLAAIPRSPVGLILCLGNSIPHLSSRDALLSVLETWRAQLVPSGAVVVQLLNYRRVLDARERIVNIRRDGTSTIVRFYDFLEDALRFNILSLHEEQGRFTHDLQSTTLLPFVQEDFETAARTAGFDTVEFHGSLQHGHFSDESPDLVVVLR